LAPGLTFCSYDGLKKTEIEVALDDYLVQNASTYSGEARLAPFYTVKRRSESSPVKKETSLTSDVETKVKSARRRVTKAAEELVAT
jgi:hypothetical protein